MARCGIWLAIVLVSLASTFVHAGETVTYRYDALGRLVATNVAGGPAGGVGTTYEHDAAGNRTRVATGGVPSPQPSATPTPSPTPTNPPPASSTPVVASPSFESPVIDNYAYQPSVPGVTFISAAGIATNGGGFEFPFTSDGNQAGFMAAEAEGTTTDTGVIIETVTGLTAGNSYRVLFKAVSRPRYSQSDALGRVRVSVGGTVLAEVGAPSGWTSFTSDAFTASGSSTSVTFAIVKVAGNSAVAIDAVQVVPASGGGSPPRAGTVPSPSFESPVVNNYAYGPSVPGVTFVSAAGIATNGGAFEFPYTSDGNQAGFMAAEPAGTTTGTGVIVQAVTGLTPGASYQVLFKTVSRPRYSQNDALGRVQVSAGNTVVADVGAPTGWTSFTSNAFTASGSSMDVTFAIVKVAGHSGVAIDAVQVVPASGSGSPPTAVTIPSSSFESPVVNSYAYGPSVPGVTFVSAAGIATNGGGFEFPFTSDGNQAGFMAAEAAGTTTDTGVIVETVTGLTPGASYRVLFKTVSRPRYSQNDALGRVRVSVGGGVVAEVGAPAEWTSITSSTFTASGESMDLTFAILKVAGNSAVAIDAIQIVLQ